MNWFDLVAFLLGLAASFSYVNHRWLRLPPTVGVTALTLVASLLVVAVGQLVPDVHAGAKSVVEHLRLDKTLMTGTLGFLLFAGALQLDLGHLERHKTAVAALATAGVLMSTVIVGGLMWVILPPLGLQVRYVDCLLFGALISPTDPVAVLSLLKSIGAPRGLEAQIAGESLFNDGIGVVVFLGVLEAATGRDPGVWHLGWLFLREAAGGAALGLAGGVIVYRLLRTVDNYQVEIMLSLALAAGGYALADRLHLSGPIAAVVAGLVIGTHGRASAMSPTTAGHLSLFWELVDEILNAMLFVLLGLEALVLDFGGAFLAAGLAAIPVVLAARFVSVGVTVAVLRRWEEYTRGTVRVLTWGGLRGGISVALALSLPGPGGGRPVTDRELILAMTYVVVVCSILVQGLTIGPLARRLLRPAPGGAGTAKPPA